MAGEVGHVVYAARILHYLGEHVSDPSYWAGTLLPDIKHFGIISRRRTHAEGVSLSNLVGKTDFQTGMRVHAWIDATREKFLNEQHIKEALPWHPFVPHALKLAEDELMYDMYDDWNLIHRVLNEVRGEELEYIPSRDHVQKWHTILQDYFKQKPTNESRRRLSLGIGLSEHSSDELNSVVTMLRQQAKVQQLLTDFASRLEDILK
ncbi:MAG: hypothetical protein HYR90_04305 [Candidatus Andersenbacteria bacterium]|nr:hypothetical protein [Candidatus Andersenbacteria bacterium]MBI3250639.1 hypothetical protein [Candidatus Andersenbacteria bacterium]